MNTQTIARHLKSHSIEKPEVTTVSEQVRLDDLKPGKLTNEYSKARVDNLLSLAFATSSVPNYFMQNQYFREALTTLNSEYSPLSRNQISMKIESNYDKLIKTLQEKIDSAPKFSICVDFWSKNTAGYIGVCLNLVENGKMQCICLGLKHVPFPHTAPVVIFYAIFTFMHKIVC